MTLPFDVDAIRSQFPALFRRVGDQPAVYLDGPGGSQVPLRVIEAVARYLSATNANSGGVFATSLESDALLDRAHAAAADLVGTPDPACTVFGANMTTLTLALARALSRTWGPGDEVLVTRLDHDANVSPWIQAARDAGGTARHVAIRPDDCTLDLDDLGSKLGPRTRLVAVGCASNAVGTINPIPRIVEMARSAGALVFLDAVHHAPHALMDVEAWDCDFLACSAYKFFGPHIGILYGRRSLLEDLPAYKLRPSSDALPHRWETGTLCHEGIAGTLEAIEYLADIGRRAAGDPHGDGTGAERSGAEAPPQGRRVGAERREGAAPADGRTGGGARAAVPRDEGGGAPDGGAVSSPPRRRAALAAAFGAIRAHERDLAARALERLRSVPGLRLYGITDPARLEERAPTFAFTLAGHTPREVAAHLAGLGIFVWDGNFYALPLTEALGLEPHGLVRAGLLHYNTLDEVERLARALAHMR